jgi:methylated-DNA-protein-cysteine methyltransferase-like protein
LAYFRGLKIKVTPILKAQTAPTAFSTAVLQIIKSIPKGRVMSYGQVAKLAGNPRGARGVGWLLHSSTRSHQLPWQRVINSQGKISFPWGTPQFSKQKKLLIKEGVSVSDKGSINLKVYAWQGED